MADANVMTQIHKGMEVRSEDGVVLGKVAHVWMGLDPRGSGQQCDEEECSRLEVRLPHRAGTCYIPYAAIAGVSGKIVSLNLGEDAFNEKLWHRRPDWLPPEEDSLDFDVLGKPPSYPGNF